MITKFRVDEEMKIVSWEHDEKKMEFIFKYPVYANHVELFDEIIIHSNVQESGERNLFLYKADGTLKCRPEMPKLKHSVGGVYSVWFVQGRRQITIVLHSDEYKPYGTACSFDLKTCKFAKFHPTY